MTLPVSYSEGQSGHLDDHAEIAAELATVQAKADAAQAAAIAASVGLTGNQTVAGVKTFSSDPIVPDEAYDATAWNGSLEPPTKNAVRDKIESLSLGGGSVAAKDEGSTVVATATAFDFVGAGVAVTDAGSGVATVSISGASLTQEQIEDYVGALLQDSSVIDVTYDDVGDAITMTIKAGAVTNAMLAKPPSDTAYDATSWDGVTDVAPSKNAVRDQVETMLTSIAAKLSSSAIDNTAYGVGWDGDTTHAPSKNAVYDKIEVLISAFAALASPAFTGNPTAPTPTAGDNDTSIATTAFVTTAVAAVGAGAFDLAQTMAFGG